MFEDIIFAKTKHVARITINRADKGNPLRTKTLIEMVDALQDAADDGEIAVVVITGAGSKHFCSGGDSSDIGGGKAGYTTGVKKIFEVERLIRMCGKPVIAAVNGWAVGGGHIMHTVCDLTIASDTARFAQVGPKVGSWEAGFGATYLARLVGEKKAREMWFLNQIYTAQEALEIGLINKVVPAGKLMEEVDSWCQEIVNRSPTAIKFLKTAMNTPTDWIYGMQRFAGEALWQYYAGDEALEGRMSFMEKRKPDYKQFLEKDR